MIYRNPTDFSIWPKVMREWMESIGVLDDIQDLELSRDCTAYVSDGGWKTYVPSDYLKLKVTISPLEHCCTFVQFNGEWMKADEGTDISCIGKRVSASYANYEAPEYMYKAPPLELNDNDAFDLMDSIRDELWSNS